MRFTGSILPHGSRDFPVEPANQKTHTPQMYFRFDTSRKRNLYPLFFRWHHALSFFFIVAQTHTQIHFVSFTSRKRNLYPLFFRWLHALSVFFIVARYSMPEPPMDAYGHFSYFILTFGVHSHFDLFSAENHSSSLQQSSKSAVVWFTVLALV